MTARRRTVLLGAAAGASAMCVPATAFIYGDAQWPYVMAFLLSLIVLPGLTVWARFDPGSQPASDAHATAATIAVLLGITTAAAVLMTGFAGVLLAFITVPICFAADVVVWVDPSPSQWPSTTLVALLLLGSLVWFLGQADESVAALVISGAGMCGSLFVLHRLRVRSARAPGPPRESLVRMLRRNANQ